MLTCLSQPEMVLAMLTDYAPVSHDTDHVWCTLLTPIVCRKDEHSLLSRMSSGDGDADTHEHKTAPLITCEAFLKAEPTERPSQYGVLGSILAVQ